MPGEGEPLNEEALRDSLRSIRTAETSSEVEGEDSEGVGREAKVLEFQQPRDSRSAEEVEMASQENRVGELDEQDAIRRQMGLPERLELNPEDEADLERISLEVMGDDEAGPETPEGAEQETEQFSKEMLDFALSGQLAEKVRELGESGEVSPLLTESVEAFEKARPLIDDLIEKAGGRDKITDSEYAQKLDGILGALQERLPPDHLDDAKREVQEAKDKPGMLKKLGSEAIDFVPVVGPCKMLGEAAAGKTMSGEELQGWRRTMHAVEGGVFLVLDAAQVGWLGKAGKKTGSKLAAKAFQRAGAVARKVGLSRKISQPIFRTGSKILKNPMLAKMVDKTFASAIKARKARKVAMAGQEAGALAA